MIIDAIVNGALLVLTGIMSLFPGYTLGGSFTSLGGGLGGSLAQVSGVVPVATIGLCIVALVGVKVFLAGVALVQWVYGLIPFN